MKDAVIYNLRESNLSFSLPIPEGATQGAVIELGPAGSATASAKVSGEQLAVLKANPIFAVMEGKAFKVG